VAERWLTAAPQLATVEAQNSSDRELMALINTLLSDRPRPGTTNLLRTEQVVQIVALACENPQASGYPVPFQWKFKGFSDDNLRSHNSPARWCIYLSEVF
jgi:putative transposase